VGEQEEESTLVTPWYARKSDVTVTGKE